MMRVAAVMARLKAQLVPEVFIEVGSLGAVPATPEAVKWQNRAYVMPRAEMVGPNRDGTDAVNQRVIRVVRIAIGFTRKTNARKFGDFDSVEDVTEAVKAALVGWTPDGETSPVEYIGSDIAYQNLETGILVWGVDVGCPYFLEA